MTEEMTASKEMPLYKCYKEVHALKMVAGTVTEDGSVIIQPADETFASFLADAEFGKRWKGTEEDPGYYVLYSDGYASWSPTKQFEEGYTLLDGGPDST